MRVCMSLETVRVKEEPEWESSASECGVSEAAARAGLYAGHAVKDELVLGPECLQPPDIFYALRAVAVPVKSEHKLTLRECSVRLERLNDAILTNTRQTYEKSSALMCDPKEENVGQEPFRYTGVSAGDGYKCDVCGERFYLKAHLIKHVAVLIHVQDNHGFADCSEAPVLACSLALAEGQPTLRECSVRLARLPAPAPPSVCPSLPPMCLPPTTAQLARVSHTGLHDPGAGDTTHTLQPSDTSRYVCDTCGKMYQRKKNLIKHIQLHLCNEAIKAGRCNISKRQLSGISGTAKLRETNTRPKRFKCIICKKKFTSFEYLKVHKRIHANDKPYFCGICEKHFTHSSALIVHIRTHTGEKPYLCEICFKEFSQYGHLQKHKLIHTGQKPYKCGMCKKQFSNKSYLRRHERVHTGEKPYSCEICHKKLAKKSTLRTHLQLHAGGREKAYSCDICKKQFAQSTYLKIHKRYHTGERPYSCEICKKRFYLSSHLNTHKLIHTGEKPFSCDVCGKKFMTSDVLKKHLLVHTGERPFSCVVCKKGFARWATLSMHNKSQRHILNAKLN